MALYSGIGTRSSCVLREGKSSYVWRVNVAVYIFRSNWLKINMLYGLRIKVKSSWLNMDTGHEIFALYNS